MRSNRPLEASLVVIPEVMVSSLTGMFDVLNCFELVGTFDDSVPPDAPFRAQLVGLAGRPVDTASGLALRPQCTIGEVPRTDIVIVPSLIVPGAEWIPGRYPELVDWLARMYDQGATLCSACSGVLLLAETGLLDGLDATLHWAYAPTFRRNFPRIRLRLERILVTSGDHERFVMCGGAASWHDLVLYLVAREVDSTAARAVSRFMLLQWHENGQAPYLVFQAPLDHQDAVVLAAQRWVHEHYSVANPVEEMVKRSGLPGRSFKRRFTKATGYAPLSYVQHSRIEAAKRRLERTPDPVDEIGWKVGYEDPAFFRRLFKRLTGIPPSAYRRKFQIPAFARQAG